MRWMIGIMKDKSRRIYGDMANKLKNGQKGRGAEGVGMPTWTTKSVSQMRLWKVKQGGVDGGERGGV